MIKPDLSSAVTFAKRFRRLHSAFPVLQAVREDLELQRVHEGYYRAFPLSMATRPLASLPRLLLGNSRYRHRAQRPHFYLPDLEAKPWWPSDSNSETLEDNWEIIAEEFARIQHEIKHHPQKYLIGAGDWSIFPLFRNRKIEQNCALCPSTMEIIESLPLCPKVLGFAYFSVMVPGTIVKPHCAPVNTRIRYHLTLEDDPDAAIRVDAEARSWEKRGECLVFDDSFEHEVWHRGTCRRVVLLVDCWHPNLSQRERTFLEALYPQLCRGHRASLAHPT